MIDFNLKIHNKKPTRHSKTCSTQIDLIISNPIAELFINNISTLQFPISDHELLFFGYKKPKYIENPIYKSKFNLNKQNISSFFSSLYEINISNIISSSQDDVDICIDNYMSIINSIISKIPKINYILKDDNHPWITTEFIALSKKRDQFFKLARKYYSLSYFYIMAQKLKSKCRNLSYPA